MSGETPEPQTVHIQGLDSAEAFEEARVVTSASWEWLVEGYRAAFSRFTATAGQRDPKARFIPLFETLNWATAILDYARKRGPRIDGEIVRGLRFARNSVHHQWADALEPPFSRTAERVMEAARGGGDEKGGLLGKLLEGS